MTQAPTRRFPWRCGDCGKHSVLPSTIPWSSNMLRNGRHHKVELGAVPAHVCSECGRASVGEEGADVIECPDGWSKSNVPHNAPNANCGDCGKETE